jgi:hypothetical protein
VTKQEISRTKASSCRNHKARQNFVTNLSAMRPIDGSQIVNIDQKQGRWLRQYSVTGRTRDLTHMVHSGQSSQLIM